MKKIILLIVTSIVSTISWSQTDPLYAQYQNNPILINPGYAGFNKTFSANASYRKQWTGFEGNPETINFNLHSSLKDNKVGLGLVLVNDKIGASSNTEINGVYAYHLPMNSVTLSLGLQAGIMNFKTDYSDLKIYDPTDPAFQSNLNSTQFNFGAGLILHNEKFFLGLSVPRMMRATEQIGEEDATIYQQHIYANAAYAFYVNERVRIKPSVLIKGVKGAMLSADANLVANFEEKYAVGIFTRNFNTYGFIAQLKFGDRYKFGYAFEVPSNKSIGTSFTTHEISVGINLSLFNFHDSLAVSVF